MRTRRPQPPLRATARRVETGSGKARYDGGGQGNADNGRGNDNGEGNDNSGGNDNGKGNGSWEGHKNRDDDDDDGCIPTPEVHCASMVFRP